MINSELWIIYALVFGAALLGFQALYWLVFRSRAERKIINRRLTLATELRDQGAVLDALRRERGLTAFANVAGLEWLDELVMQSGLKLDVTRLPAAYRYMTELDPSGWAWEFLRRNPDYRADAAKLAVLPEAARPPDGSGRHWGLQSPGEPGPPRR